MTLIAAFWLFALEGLILTTLLSFAGVPMPEWLVMADVEPSALSVGSHALQVAINLVPIGLVSALASLTGLSWMRHGVLVQRSVSWLRFFALAVMVAAWAPLLEVVADANIFEFSWIAFIGGIALLGVSFALDQAISDRAQLQAALDELEDVV